MENKTVFEEFFEEIANWCVDVGSTQSSNGSYHIYASDIIEMFDVTQEWLNEKANEISDYIIGHEDILDTTDVFFDENGNFEDFGLWIAGNAICKKCGQQNSAYCPGCEVAHDEEWDEYEEDDELTLKDINLTRETKKAIKNYNLKNIYIGSLSTVPNCRYIRENKELCFDVKELGNKIMTESFVIVFNHFEWSHSCWTVWETPYMDFESIKQIADKEFHRKLWDSRHLYYDDGKELIQICSL